MGLISWGDEYSVNVKAIDSQHKNLIDIINKLHFSLQKGESKLVLGEIFLDLKEYADKHFKYEEHLLEKYDISSKESHAKEHNELLDKVYELNNDFVEQNNYLIGVEVIMFLKNWLINHIQGTDYKSAELLNSKGVF